MPGPGSGPSDWSLQGQSPPFGDDPWREFRVEPEWGKGVGLARCGPVPGVVPGEPRLSYSSATDRCWPSSPDWKKTIFRDQLGNKAGERRHPTTACRLLSEAKYHPPLPFADLGLIRLFFNQPTRGRLTRTCRPRGFGQAERTRVIADPVRHIGRLSRGGWSSAPKDRSRNPCPTKMPPPTPPASPPH